MKNMILKSATLIFGLGVLSSSVVGISLTSCSKTPPNPEPTPDYDYVGNDDGTDWKGWISDTIQLGGYDKSSYTCKIIGSSQYTANNLIIPKYISNDDEIYEITTIAGGSLGVFYNSNLSGSIMLPDSIITIGHMAFGYGTGNLTGTLTIPSSVKSIDSYAFGSQSFDSVDMRGVTNYCSLGCGWIYNCKNIGTFYAPSNILWTDTDTSWYNVGNSNAQFIANLPNAGRAESWFNANVKIGGGGNNWTFSWAKS